LKAQIASILFSTSQENQTMESPEALIAAMTSDELQELLSEIGIEATESQVMGIKSLVAQLGSLEAVLETLESFQADARRAA
jgi:hypothetical protein